MVSLRIAGFRRFERESTLDLTPRVLAVVGPNEAGKSSLLDAMEYLTTPPEDGFKDRDFSGWSRPEDEKTIISALFEIEDDDKAKLEGIPGAQSVRLWHTWRKADASADAEIIPRPVRPQERRMHVRDDLARLLARKSRPGEDLWSQRPSEVFVSENEEEESPEVPEDEPSVEELASQVLSGLNEEGETLSPATREGLRTLGAALATITDEEGAPNYLREMPAACASLVDEHEEDHPYTRIRRILDEREPQVRVLRESDRQLQTSYQFEEFEEPPAPLENLLSLAEVSWSELKAAAATPGNPVLQTLQKRANRNLEKRLHGSWRQSKVSIELNEQNGWLNVFPYDAESDEHSRIEERSDGFRAFLALLAFTTRHSKEGRKLVLGIDEAEMHLHYDAQVDLVNVLTEQTFATQIVYTTHSAGCLPEDLGSAIRVVSPVAGDRSKIQNAFWSSQAEDGSGGFTSLLMAMGAEAVAFTPARRAVIAEGPSDALLLPALFREAAGLGRAESLQLQVAGGLASTPPRLLPQLEGEAGHVVYLADSDPEGLNYEQALLDAGLPAERIFTLRDGEEDGLSIEDFVEKSLYVEVVNLLAVELRGHEGLPYELDAAPEAGIAKHAERWASEQGIEPLPKPAVAEHLLRLSAASLAYAAWDPEAERKPRALLRASRGLALREILSDIRGRLALGSLEVNQDQSLPSPPPQGSSTLMAQVD